MAYQTNSIPFVDLGAQYRSLESEINAAIRAVLQRTDFILGSDVEQFEREFADFCGTEHGIGVDSGLSALALLLEAYGIGPGDEVITAANTFIASALAISQAGAVPVLVDIDPTTYAIDPQLIEQAITLRTKAIMPVHLYGHPADMDPILDIANRHSLVVIEDASQAHGAKYRGRTVGSIGHASAFSLYPAKNLGAYGDAGVIVTNDAAIDRRIRLLRNYGCIQKYHHEIQGYNHRLDTLHAAILRVKLRHLDGWNAARRQNARLYSSLLAEGQIVCPTESSDVISVYHLYVIRTDDRDQLQAHLTQAGIATVIHYPIPLHLQPAYKSFGYLAGDFPITEQYADQVLSIPMFPELTSDQIEYVAETVLTWQEAHSGRAAAKFAVA